MGLKETYRYRVKALTWSTNVVDPIKGATFLAIEFGLLYHNKVVSTRI